jgi:hypothetical protein
VVDLSTGRVAPPVPFLAWARHGGAHIVIDGTILNPPFAEPGRPFRFDNGGIPVVEKRRLSSYFMPIPKAKKKGGQLAFDEWTGDRIVRDRIIRYRTW